MVACYFSCPAWTVEDGPGELAATTLIEGDPRLETR